MGRMKDWQIEYDGTRYDAFPDSHEVFILGAGFSKAVTPDMPTMVELTNKLKELNLLSDHDSHVEDFEILLNSLSLRHPWLTEAEYLRNRARYIDIARAIADILRKCSRRAWSSPSPDFLKTLFDYWSTRRCTIITLNYDTLVESLFWAQSKRVPKPPEAIERADVEGISFSRLFEDFTFLKLHGLIDWFFSGNTEYENEPIFYYRPYNTQTSSAAEHARDDCFMRGSSHHFGPDIPPVWDKQPFIVPPLVEKTPFFKHHLLRSQWTLASQALKRARRLFFIGYSMPLTDLTIRYLLTTASWNAEHEDPVMCTIVDRNSKVAKRYEEALGTGSPSNVHYKIGHVISGTNCLSQLARTLDREATLKQ